MPALWPKDERRASEGTASGQVVLGCFGEPAGEFDLGAVGTVPPDMDRMAAAAAAADVEILGPPPFETDV